MKNKKLFTSLFILSAASLASCTVVVNPPVTFEEALAQAKAQVYYTDEAETGVSGNFVLSATSIVDDYTFNVAYTAGNLNPETLQPDAHAYTKVSGEDVTFITVAETNDLAMVIPPNFLDPELNFKERYGSSAFCYLDAVFSCEGHEETATRRYRIKVNGVSSCTIEELYTNEMIKTNDIVEFDGYYNGAFKDDDVYGGCFVADGKAGCELYGLSELPEDIKVGDPVHVSGAYSPYNGLIEVGKPLSIRKLTDEAAIAKISNDNTIEFNKDTVWEYKNLSCPIHVEGTIVDSANSGEGTARRIIKCNIQTEDGAKVYVYGDEKYMSPENFEASWAAMVEGAKVDVTGFVGYHKSSSSQVPGFDPAGVQISNPLVKA